MENQAIAEKPNYIPFTNNRQMIEDNREVLLKKTAELKRIRTEELGFDGLNKPVVFLAGVQKDVRIKGKKRGWFVDIVPFHLVGCQMQKVAIERAENLGYVVIDYDLPEEVDLQTLMSKDKASGTAFLDTAKYNNYRELVEYCKKQSETNKIVLNAKGSQSEMLKKAAAAEQRAKAAEAELAELKKAQAGSAPLTKAEKAAKEKALAEAVKKKNEG